MRVLVELVLPHEPERGQTRPVPVAALLGGLLYVLERHGDQNAATLPFAVQPALELVGSQVEQAGGEVSPAQIDDGLVIPVLERPFESIEFVRNPPRYEPDRVDVHRDHRTHGRPDVV